MLLKVYNQVSLFLTFAFCTICSDVIVETKYINKHLNPHAVSQLWHEWNPESWKLLILYDLMYPHKTINFNKAEFENVSTRAVWVGNEF